MTKQGGHKELFLLYLDEKSDLGLVHFSKKTFISKGDITLLYVLISLISLSAVVLSEVRVQSKTTNIPPPPD